MKKENKKLAKERKALAKKKQKQQAIVKKVLLIAIPVLLIAAGLWALFLASKEDTSNGNDSAGEISNDSIVNDFSTEEFDTSLPELSSDPSRTVAFGDTVNIDYVGTIDGVEFAGGSTGGIGTDLTIGSGMYIDDFEDQLVGYKAGDTVEVVVTFPDDYGMPELSGKEAVFTTVINAIYDVY